MKKETPKRIEQYLKSTGPNVTKDGLTFKIDTPEELARLVLDTISGVLDDMDEYPAIAASQLRLLHEMCKLIVIGETETAETLVEVHNELSKQSMEMITDDSSSRRHLA